MTDFESLQTERIVNRGKNRFDVVETDWSLDDWQPFTFHLC
jgi:hypothetical protein